MEFELVGIVVVMLLGLALTMFVSSKLGGANEGTTLQSIIESASGGQDAYMHLTPEVDMDLCAQVEGEWGCDSPLGVEPYCELEHGQTYLIHAVPTPSGVCLNFTEMGQ